MSYDIDTYRDEIKTKLDAGFLLLSQTLSKPAIVSRSFPDGAGALEELESDAKKYSNASSVIFITFLTQEFGNVKLTPGSYATACGYRLFIYTSSSKNDETILDYAKATRDILHKNGFKLLRLFSNPVRVTRGGMYVAVIDFEVKLIYAGA